MRDALCCSVQSLPDASVLTDFGCGRPRLAFPATGTLLVASDAGHWVVSSSRAIWLLGRDRPRIRALGNVRMKSFVFDPECSPELPDHSCVLHVTPLLREVMRSLTGYGSQAQSSRKALLLGELLLEKVIDRVPAPIELPEPSNPRLAAICARIQLQPDDATTLGQFAADMGCSERTLHRLFLQETGMSFTVWRHQAKLRLALEWLAQGRSILDISLGLGYQNQGAFTTMFRKYLGAAPSRYARPAPGSALA
ncbi:AraC family transcriptional regulator [Castellaniella sp. GW247-6E4]|uniref:AraC family transcriptional regulator n=1 Tax=Castellaniella sp. GW247-6E4 TaxID=3140380 RepID=UPI003315E601